MKTKAQHGFTLIQALITIALVGILSMLASPLTGAFANDAKVTETEGVLTQAIGKAKSIALRNEAGITGATAVAAICISATKLLTVEEGTSSAPANCATANGTVVWSAQMNSSVSIKAKESGVYQDVSCLCYGNKGLLQGSGCSTSSCASNTQFQLNAGSKAEVVSLF